VVAGPFVAAPTIGSTPATVVITLPETLRMRLLRSGNEKVAGGVHGDGTGRPNVALVAGPLSPLKPRESFPPQW